MSDQLTAAQRLGAVDCLSEITAEWLGRSVADLGDDERGNALHEVCLWISQMRHRDPRAMDLERRRWLERVAAKLCRETPGGAGHERIALQNLETITTVAMLRYHEWRETYAPVVKDHA